MTAGIVAELERQLPLECLRIRDPRLRLDTAAPPSRSRAADLRVPRPQVAVNRERYLRAPAKARVEDGSQSFEQSLRGRIPERVAARIGSERKIQSDYGAPRANVADVYDLELATFEPPEFGIGRSRRIRARSQTQPTGDSRLPVLAPETAAGLSGSAPTAIARSIPRSHFHEPSTGALGWRSTGSSVTVTGRRRYLWRHKGPARSGPNVDWFAGRDKRRLKGRFRVIEGMSGRSVGRLSRHG